MDITIIDTVDFYRARIEQLEREYLSHQLLQQEIRTDPAITGDKEIEQLAGSEAAVTQIEVAHEAATQLLADAEANQPPPTADDTAGG